jgi:DNA-binding transcriptional ArsR family regulator/YHS domain-containing protein
MFNKVFDLHAQFLKALAHPKRLEIINLLRDQKVCVGKMQEMLGLPQANLSQHLQVLRDIKVLKSIRKGKQIYYQLAHPNIVKACDLIRDVLIDQNKDSDLKTYLEKVIEDYLPIAVDPVCDMRVSAKRASYVHKHDGHNYYFCAEGCLKKFKKNPKKFVDKN